MAGATRSIVFNAPIERCYAVIADFERYPEFLPEVKKIRTANRRGHEVDVHYEAEIVKIIRYTIRAREEKPTRVSWSFVDGEFMKDNRGSWALEDLGGAKTRATYSIEVAVGLLVPKSLLNVLIDTQLPRLLENFKARIESAQ
jgi:coenzyme Q-binding protein COQ10